MKSQRGAFAPKSSLTQSTEEQKMLTTFLTWDFISFSSSLAFITKEPSPNHKGKISIISTQILAKDAQRDF